MKKFGQILLYIGLGLGALCTAVGCGNSSGESDSALETGNPANHPHNVHAYFSDPLRYERQRPVHKGVNGPAIPAGERHHDRIHINSVGRLADVFNDSNKYQYAWAERVGIQPITNLNGALRTSRPLVYITSCEAYGVDELTHSLPYLVPEAADLLETIGYNFIDSLRRRGADGYKVKVTSLLRTPSTVKKLRRVNKNATDSSTHQFGTTFDLSWSKFVCADSTRTIDEGDLKNLLAEVLLDLRLQNRCMVKFERKTACFHITVTPQNLAKK